MPAIRDLIPVLDAWAADGRRVALCTVVAVHGRAPLPLGASLVVADDGATAGAVSGGCVERDVIEVAQQVLRGALPRRLRFAPGHDGLTGTGLPCGGGIDVWVQQWNAGPYVDEHAAFAATVRAGDAAELTFQVGPLGLAAAHEDPTVGVATSGGAFTLSAPALGRMILVGAGPVAGALAQQAEHLGMVPVIVDPRPAVAAHAPTDAASELLLAWPEDAMASLAPLREVDAVIALSHQPTIDDAALRAAIASDAGFIGALGSRTAHESRLERLRGRGVDEASLARIVGPVGLDLGGWAPSEVALSIAAELVAMRHGRAGGRLVEKEGSIHEPASSELAVSTTAGDGAGAAFAEPAPAAPLLPGAPVGSSPITGVVLAAGAGRRFGGAKAAAEWDGETLVARAVRAAASGLPEGSDLIVVVGAHEATVRAALPPVSEVPHRVVVAERWQEGMGASLQAGLAEVRSMGAMVLLADQPLVDAELVARVVREGCPAIREGAAAARPVAGDVPGHPVLLGPIALTRAFDLSGDRGLAPLLEPLHVHAVAVEGLASVMDVDQPADLLRAPVPSAPVGSSRQRPRTAGGRGPAPQAQPLREPARQRRGAAPRSGRDRPWT